MVVVVELLETGARRPSAGQKLTSFMYNRLAMMGRLPDFWTTHYLFERLEREGVSFRFATELKEISSGQLTLVDDGKEQVMGPFDTVVFALG